MKIIIKSLLACLVMSMPIFGSPFTPIKQAIKNHPIATVGLSCLAGCVGLYVQAVYHQETNKKQIKKIKDDHKEKVDSRKKLEDAINTTMRKGQIIPGNFRGHIDLTIYTNEERKELKQLIGNYNATVENYNKGTDAKLKKFYVGCVIEAQKDIRKFIRKTSKLNNPEVARYQNAETREEWSVYLCAATLMGIAVAAANDYNARHPELYI